jgi:hypothetical protein
MDGIITDASNSRNDAHRRAVAHELSAEWHRKVGVRLGLAIASASIFATVTASLGLDGKGTLTIPQEFWSLVLFYGVIALLILAPVISAWQTSLNEPDQVKRHTSDSAGYYREKERLDRFIRKYENVNLADEARESAIKELDEISTAIAKLREKSISLTTRAYKDADKRLSSGRTLSSGA